jgi:hypothetical protein
MLNDLDKMLQRVIDEYGYLCGIIALSSGQEIMRYGNFAALQWKDLSNSLFGDAEAIVRLDQSLEGQILPQVFSQGDVRCAVMKPKEEIIVGIFDQSGKDLVSFYKECKEISKRLADLERSDAT